MQYETPSGLIVNDRRHFREDPRNWDPNANPDPAPGDSGVGPTASEGFGNAHAMYQDPNDIEVQLAQALSAPPVQAWSGWPVEWSTPNWGGMIGMPAAMQRLSTMFGAMDLNSSILSSMPPYRMQKVGDRDERIEPTQWMLNPQPEVYTGWMEALKQVVLSYWAGEAFLWCTSRYSDGTVRTWVMLDPAWVTIHMAGQIRRYEMHGVPLDDRDVLHLRFASWPGYKHGIGPIEALASNIAGAQALERYQSQLASRGGVPWGVLTAPGNLKAGQADNLRAGFVSARMSAMGAPAVLSGGVTLTPFNINPKDMALIELRMFDEARIAILLGVPPLLMGLPSGDSMTYKNAEGIYDFHWRAYLRPKASAIMEAISNWALVKGQRVEVDRDEYVRPDFNNRVIGYQALFNMLDPVTGKRGITIDEMRQRERLPALPNQPLPPPPPPPVVSQPELPSPAPETEDPQ